MLSEGAERLRDALREAGGRTLCLPCGGFETGLDVYETRKAVRELILSGVVLATPSHSCSACHRPDLVLRLRGG